MRALFEKDIRIVLMRKSTLLIFLVIGVIFTWSYSNYFSGAYLTMLGTMIALSTISYDDADNCMAFLFTLPCTRKQYVLEKYMFVYGFSFLAGLTGLVIIVVSSMVKGEMVNEVVIIETLASEIPILVITGGIMIPLQLKFGSEKSRIILMSLIGIVLIIGVIATKNDRIKSLVDYLDNTLNSNTPIGALLVLIIILIVLSVISVCISGRIVDRKEY